MDAERYQRLGVAQELVALGYIVDEIESISIVMLEMCISAHLGGD